MSDRTKRSLLAIILLGVLLRLAASIFFGEETLVGPGTADQISYHNLALRLASGHGFSFDEPWWPLTQPDAPTAHWSYLYTYYLAAVYVLFGPNPLAARLIQSVVVGLLQPLLAFLIGRRLGGAKVGLASAGVTALYAYFIYYSASLMTEAFYFTAVLASLYLAISLADDLKASHGSSARQLQLSAALGAILGAAVLLRQVLLLFIPLLLIWIWLAVGRKKAAIVVLPALIVGTLVLPFTLFNYSRFDRFVLLNTNAGFAFFWANHPIYGTQFQPILPEEIGNYQELIPEDLRGLDEAAMDQQLLRRGLQFVANDPVRYIRLSLSRIPAYFMFWPSEQSSFISNVSRTLSFGFFLPFMLYGLVLAWIERGAAVVLEPVGVLTLFVVFYSAIHLLSWALIRYRLPVDAVLVGFAGYALVDLAQRIGARHRHAPQPA
jgi:hypothetical protein